MGDIAVMPLGDAPQHLSVCAQWNFDQWGKAAGRSLAETSEGLDEILRRPGEEAVLATVGGEPAGMALLIGCDLPSHAHLTPWVAGLLTVSAFRNKGIASALLNELETIAQLNGFEKLYLYTEMPEFYRRRGWTVIETFEEDGFTLTILEKQL